MVLYSDLLPAFFFALTFISILIVSEFLYKNSNLSAEATRKLGHAAAGILCLFLPYLITSWKTVAVLNGSMMVLFILARAFNRLPGLFNVGRTGRGVIYFPAAVFIVFVLTADHYAIYISSILSLALADAAAALAGKRYGSVLYEVEGSHKSLEGSLVFLLLTFLCIAIPLYVMMDFSLSRSILCASLVALLMTGVEAISLRGSDNLFIPIAVCQILERITVKPLGEVIYQNISLFSIGMVLIVCVDKVPSFNIAGAITIVLFTYATWSLGSEEWALPVLLAFGAFLLSWRFFCSRIHLTEKISIRVATRVALVPLCILLTANIFEQYNALYGPFLASMSFVVTGTVWRQWVLVLKVWKDSLAWAGLLGFISGFFLSIIPFFWQRLDSPFSLLSVLLSTALAAMLLQFFRVEEKEEDYTPNWPLNRIALTAVAAGLVYVAQSAGVNEWNPSVVTGVARL